MDLVTGEITSLKGLEQGNPQTISKLEITLRSIRADLQRIISTEGLDEELAAIAGLTSAANKLPYFTGSGTASLADLTAFARSILDDANEATFKATVNLEIGTDVQAYDAGLTNLAGVAMAADKFYYTTADNVHVAASVTAFARTILDDANAATVRGTISALANMVEDATPELGGELDCGAHTIGFTQQTATGDGTTTINWTLGNKFYFTFGAQNDTFTFTAPSNPCNLILVLKQDGVGSRTATWPATVLWPAGAAPILSTAVNAVDIVSFYYDGTNYFGNSSLNFS